MIDRRKLLSLGLASLVVEITGNFCCSTARAFANRSGCLRTIEEFSKLTFFDDVVSAANNQINSGFTKNIIENPMELEFLTEILATKGVPLLHGPTGFKPTLGYYDEGEDGGGMNALASPLKRSNEFPHGTIVFGKNLALELTKYRSGGFAAFAVLAHEWGHLWSFNTDLAPKIRKLLPPYGPELHADFMSGYFVALLIEDEFIAKKIFPFGSFDIRDAFSEVINTFQTFGSPENQGSGSHGTTQQRVEAVNDGMRYKTEGSKAPWAHAVAEFAIEHLERYQTFWRR